MLALIFIHDQTHIYIICPKECAFQRAGLLLPVPRTAHAQLHFHTQKCPPTSCTATPPPNFEAQLKCHLLPKAFLDDSNPHKSLPTPI